jgi:hypothetical protein
MNRSRSLLALAAASTLALVSSTVSWGGVSRLAERTPAAAPDAGTHRAVKVPLTDACDINPVFCGTGGTSDIPEFLSGFAIFVAGVRNGQDALMTVMVNGSTPNEVHRVYLCPGTVSDTTGFVGCRLIGSFITNIEGKGAFHTEFRDGVPPERYLALNVVGLATVLANCPDSPSANCGEPRPMH